MLEALGSGVSGTMVEGVEIAVVVVHCFRVLCEPECFMYFRPVLASIGDLARLVAFGAMDGRAGARVLRGTRNE